jgi:DNA-binding MarR family transcriptional regulator
MGKGMERHIGYWLKNLDRLIEAAAERIFTEEDLTRRHWQTLNVLRRSPQDEAGLTEALRPFWGTEAITLAEVTNDLTARGWLTHNVHYALTPTGETAHAALEQKILSIRATAQHGLTDDDYHQTVRTLQHMATNLQKTTP